jgi:SAM-dependent methyltransferase
MASTYDATFTDTKVGRALREIVWSRLEQVFRSSLRILELGCGTGEDAVWLASSGVRVVATDPSSQMIQVARRKTLTANCQERIEFHCIAMEDLGSFANGEVFDGVLSNFGAVNCVQDLQTLVADVADRLAPGAPLLWVVMGRHAPWEWLWYLMRGQWRKAWRRLLPGGTKWRGMTISYPTPAQMTSLLRPYFTVTRLAPLGVWLPPSYAAAWLDRWPFAVTVLTRLERWAQRSSMLASWADHFIVEAVRQPP